MRGSIVSLSALYLLFGVSQVFARNTHEDEVYYFDKGELCIKNSWFTLFFCILFFVSACQIIIGIQLLRDKKTDATGTDKASNVANTDDSEMNELNQDDIEKVRDVVVKDSKDAPKKKKKKTVNTDKSS